MADTSTEMRARLRAVKLAALVRQHLGEGAAEPVPGVFPGGAAATVGSSAWVLVDERPARSLGGAVAWALRAGCDEVNLLAESATGLLARRAAEFSFPVSVWHVDGRSLLPAVAEPLPAAPAPAEDHLALVDLIVAGGASPVVEHGVVAGEVEGLEVCRVVADESTGAARLEVGIGVHDREAFMLLHGARPTVEALADVVAAVRVHRQPGAAPHPLNRLAVERRLRHAACADPGRLGVRDLHPVDPPTPRSNVKDAVPCVAVGRSLDGRPVVAVFSAGVDLDVVPVAADARMALHGADDDVDLIVVVPERDRLAVTEDLAGLLRHPARVVGWTE